MSPWSACRTMSPASGWNPNGCWRRPPKTHCRQCGKKCSHPLHCLPMPPAPFHHAHPPHKNCAWKKATPLAPRHPRDQWNYPACRLFARPRITSSTHRCNAPKNPSNCPPAPLMTHVATSMMMTSPRTILALTMSTPSGINPPTKNRRAPTMSASPASNAPMPPSSKTTPTSRKAPSMSLDPQLKSRLAELVKELAVVHGKVTLSSGKEADYYVDMRRAPLQHEASRIIGKLVRELTSDWDYVAVGGLTLGADPVATAIMHAEGRDIDAFVVRKEAKKHGMQRRIEGANVVGQKVLVVEDTTTTGNSPLTAVAALREAGAEVVGVATVVDRATGAADVIAAEGLEYRYLLDLADLGL